DADLAPPPGLRHRGEAGQDRLAQRTDDRVGEKDGERDPYHRLAQSAASAEAQQFGMALPRERGSHERRVDQPAGPAAQPSLPAWARGLHQDASACCTWRAKSPASALYSAANAVARCAWAVAYWSSRSSWVRSASST